MRGLPLSQMSEGQQRASWPKGQDKADGPTLTKVSGALPKQ
jgi:hypothetical protein